jgi:hypothetical protein
LRSGGRFYQLAGPLVDHLPCVRHAAALDDLVLEVQLQPAIDYQKVEQVADIASVELASVECNGARDIGCAIDPDTVHLENLPRSCHLTVAT